LAELGAKVAVTARNLAEVEKVASELSADRGQNRLFVMFPTGNQSLKPARPSDSALGAPEILSAMPA